MWRQCRKLDFWCIWGLAHMLVLNGTMCLFLLHAFFLWCCTFTLSLSHIFVCLSLYYYFTNHNNWKCVVSSLGLPIYKICGWSLHCYIVKLMLEIHIFMVFKFILAKRVCWIFIIKPNKVAWEVQSIVEICFKSESEIIFSPIYCAQILKLHFLLAGSSLFGYILFLEFSFGRQITFSRY